MTIRDDVKDQLRSGTMLDVSGGEVVEVEMRSDGSVMWVNVDGITVLRICRIKDLTVTDHRRKPLRQEQAGVPESILEMRDDLEGIELGDEIQARWSSDLCMIPDCGCDGRPHP